MTDNIPFPPGAGPARSRKQKSTIPQQANVPRPIPSTSHKVNQTSALYRNSVKSSLGDIITPSRRGHDNHNCLLRISSLSSSTASTRRYKGMSILPKISSSSKLRIKYLKEEQKSGSSSALSSESSQGKELESKQPQEAEGKPTPAESSRMASLFRHAKYYIGAAPSRIKAQVGKITSSAPQADSSTVHSREAVAETGMTSEDRKDDDTVIVSMPSDRVLSQLLESLKDAEIGKIGILGGAGVGKTYIIRALKSLPEVRNMFTYVICVGALKEWSIANVQMAIAQKVLLHPPEKADEDEFSMRLLQVLELNSFLLLLDGAPELIDLDKVGIPKPTAQNGSKIVLTTRSNEVCRLMAVDLKIKTGGLSPEASWQLFHQHVGEAVHSSDIKTTARGIVEACGGHPLSIILMARDLQKAEDVEIWNNALHKLNLVPTSQRENREKLMSTVVKFSYEQLADDTRRICFRWAANYPKNQEVDSASLIDSWIACHLIDTLSEGWRILEDLVSAFLLEKVHNKFSVKMNELIQDVMNSTQIYLMKGGFGLTEPPRAEEWAGANEIQLMDNKLSTLPESPYCPRLSALYLQRNYKLRRIPSSFFNDMPALRVLNLSKTKIKVLPESIFKLVQLQRFLLKDCECFMQLPPEVGNLSHLEELDLEGKEIIDLPEKLKSIRNLRFLNVFFNGDMIHESKTKLPKQMIPSGTISSLSQLEELSINVNPDDQRWYDCAEVIVEEICSLKMLDTVVLYLPDVNLLQRFMSSIKAMKLVQFRFTVGRHATRFLSHISHDTMFEFQRQEKCLRYVNGQDIPKPITEVLGHATAFYLDRHMTAEKLSDFGIENLNALEFCILGECSKMQTIIEVKEDVEIVAFKSLQYLHVHRLNNLSSLWTGNVGKGNLENLKTITLNACPKLTTIFTLSMLQRLHNLEVIQVEDCQALEQLSSYQADTDSITCLLPSLKRLSLQYLPKLVGLFPDLKCANQLERISIYYCWNLKILPIESHSQLKEIKGESNWWNNLELNGDHRTSLNSIFVSVDGEDYVDFS